MEPEVIRELIKQHNREILGYDLGVRDDRQFRVALLAEFGQNIVAEDFSSLATHSKEVEEVHYTGITTDIPDTRYSTLWVSQEQSEIYHNIIGVGNGPVPTFRRLRPKEKDLVQKQLEEWQQKLDLTISEKINTAIGTFTEQLSTMQRHIIDQLHSSTTSASWPIHKSSRYSQSLSTSNTEGEGEDILSQALERSSTATTEGQYLLSQSSTATSSTNGFWQSGHVGASPATIPSGLSQLSNDYTESSASTESSARSSDGYTEDSFLDDRDASPLDMLINRRTRSSSNIFRTKQLSGEKNSAGGDLNKVDKGKKRAAEVVEDVDNAEDGEEEDARPNRRQRLDVTTLFSDSDKEISPVHSVG